MPRMSVQLTSLIFALMLMAAPPALAKGGRVPVTPPANVVTDPSLAAFRAKLGEIAKARDLTALKGLMAKSFFWERDLGGGYNAKATPLENLTEALSLDDAKLSEEEKGTGWQRLQAIVASTVFMPDKHSGDQEGALTVTAVCGPTAPSYKEDLVPDEFAWGYVLGRADVRAKPSPTAPSIGTLENEAVEVIEAAWGTNHPGFDKVKLPSGKVGYVAESALHGFLEDQLCFSKTNGAWQIVGYVGGGD